MVTSFTLGDFRMSCLKAPPMKDIVIDMDFDNGLKAGWALHFSSKEDRYG